MDKDLHGDHLELDIALVRLAAIVFRLCESRRSKFAYGMFVDASPGNLLIDALPRLGLFGGGFATGCAR